VRRGVGLALPRVLVWRQSFCVCWGRTWGAFRWGATRIMVVWSAVIGRMTRRFTCRVCVIVGECGGVFVCGFGLVVGACGAGWVAACGACESRGASGGSGQSACAGVGAFGGVWVGVGGAVSDRAGVWECEGGVWELCGVSALVLCAGAGVEDVGVVELGAVAECGG
jgi:hypothetical protein